MIGLLTLSMAAGGSFGLAEMSVGGDYAAFVTSGVRLGYKAGRPFTFYLNFSLAAASTLHESNGQYSTVWSAVAASNGTEVRDVVASKTLALDATFRASPDATVSFLSFGELAAGSGGYMCQNSIGVGAAPAACTLGAAAVQVTDCDPDRCWVPVSIPNEPLSIASVQSGVVLADCVVRGNVEGNPVCLSPAGTVVRAGQTYASYTLGLGAANPSLAWWYDGKGRGELYVPTAFMDQLEAAALVALATITFVLWCEQTAVVTQYVKAVATDAKITGPILAFSATGSNYILILAADIAATLAYGLTAMCYRIGRGMIAPAAAELLPLAYSSMLAISACALAWMAAVLVGILTLYSPPEEGAAPELVRSYATKMVAVRCTFEVATLIAIHTFLPTTALAEFGSVVGLLFGLVMMVVISRDLCFVLWLRARWATALVAIVWTATFQFASFALILPAASASSAVSSSQHTALLYAATLSLQATAAGVMDALRKFERA